jgi:hypothetical protein
MSMKTAVLRWAWGGVLFVLLAGSALHFVFEWTGFYRPIAWLAAVNESTWEHMKLAFWPGVVWAMAEGVALRRQVNNFWVATFLGLLAMPTLIAALFYTYSAILGGHVLPADIVVFVLSVVLGQMAATRTMTAPRVPERLQWAAVVGLVMLVAVFAVVTYYPPRIFLFQDPASLHYGILDHYH